MTIADDLRQLAADLAQEAGDLAKRRRAEGVALADTKSTLADIVTHADREVEALIRDRLRVERPDDGFLGEESGDATGTSGYTWVIDPIDGTVNYAYGVPMYSTSIAVVRSGDPDVLDGVASAVCAPALGELFTAASGEGAWHNGQRLAVTRDWPAGALLATGFGYDPRTHAGDLATVARVMPLARDLRRGGSAAIDLAYLAAGRLDGFFERGLHPWDYAAGALMIAEAGGTFERLGTVDEARRMCIAGDAALVKRIRERVEAAD